MNPTTSTSGCDPWQMQLIHRLLRRGFTTARDVLRAEPEPGQRKAILDYVQFHLVGLNAHHTSEDEHLWPRLLERVSIDDGTVQRMEEQHLGLHEAVEAAARCLASWSTSPTGEARAQLGDSLESLSGRMDEHFADEEEHVVPLIAIHISAAEWEALGKAAFEKFSPAQRFTAMGEMLRTATPQEAQQMMAELPLPVRVVWRLVGRPRYERTMARLAA